ncbi:MAG TPA: helix-turn-helix domain-containing protein, partial [Clostridia bacterium]|nr:helix-turn-helix domain-containing protein [Clostridia bacterium]
AARDFLPGGDALAGEQLDAINRILKHSNYIKLSPVLRETVELRLNYPQASLQELASIAGVGKSGMNHRLQRLIRLSRELT